MLVSKCSLWTFLSVWKSKYSPRLIWTPVPLTEVWSSTIRPNSSHVTIVQFFRSNLSLKLHPWPKASLPCCQAVFSNTASFGSFFSPTFKLCFETSSCSFWLWFRRKVVPLAPWGFEPQHSVQEASTLPQIQGVCYKYGLEFFLIEEGWGWNLQPLSCDQVDCAALCTIICLVIFNTFWYTLNINIEKKTFKIYIQQLGLMVAYLLSD